MKKILFCAAVAAMATACTEDDGLVLNQEKASKGLSFDVALAENAVTRGELWREDNGTYPFFWYAEKDRIDVQAINVTAGSSNSTGAGVATATSGVWTLASAAAEYKATKSAGQGQFTAVSDANILELKTYNSNNVAGTTATIVATYGDVNAKSVTSNTAGGKEVPGSLSELILTTSSSNDALTVKPNEVKAPMYSVSSTRKVNSYDAFGEKASLSMIRPFPLVRFTSSGISSFAGKFGKLKSITLTMLGGDAETGALTASKIEYAASQDYPVIGGTGVLPAFFSDADVTVNVNQKWYDGDAIYMTVAPVDRSAFKEAGQKELFKIEYKFDNITFTVDPTRTGAADFEKILATENSWSAKTAAGAPNAVTPLPALDIQNYSYLVTEETTFGAKDRSLIVLKGSFSDIFLPSGNIKWGAVAGVPVNEIKSISSNVALTDAELGKLQNFTSLAELELKANTKIPANTLTSTQATRMTKLILPAVTEIESDFIKRSVPTTPEAFVNLVELNLASYNFDSSDSNVNAAFFNSNVASNLVTLNIAGVSSMTPTFGIERELSFKNYGKLDYVTVKDGVQLSASAFENCSLLSVVKGKVKIAGAVNAFAMSTPNNLLETINIVGTSIPSGAFTNCKALKNVKLNGSQVAPTSVGASAFEGCSALLYMDLSNMTTVGAKAFLNSGLTKDTENGQVLTVGATSISANAFEGTNVKMVDFTKATSFDVDILKSAANLIQVRFLQKFTVSAKAQNAWMNTFGTAANVVLFVQEGQSYVESNTLKLPSEDTTTSPATATEDIITFKGIYNN